MNEIQLIPTIDLLQELDKRYPEGFIAAWYNTDHERDVDKTDHSVHFGYGSNRSLIALAQYIQYNLQKDYIELNREAIDMEDD